MKLINNLKQFLLKGKVQKNVSWILIQNIYTMLLGLILTSIAARHYGTSGYGLINFGASFVSLFTFIAVFGTDQIIIKDLSQKKYSIGTIIGSNLFVRIFLSIISLIVSQLVAYKLYDNSTNIVILLFNINVIINCSDIISFYAQSKIKNKYISLSKMISVTFFSLFKLIVILLNLNILYFSLTYILENIIYSILLIISYKKIRENDTVIFRIDKDYIKELIKKSKYYALSTLMVTIYMKVDQVMLGSIINDVSVVGIYSAAVRISEIWTFVPLAVITSFKPIIFESKKENREKYINNLKKLYNIISSICFVFFIGIVVFGKIGILILYGKAYLEAYIPLIILAFGTWIGVLGNIHFIWMTCEGKEKYSLLYSFVGSLLNIILNMLLIPKYSFYGAAIATLISQISSNIIAFLFLKNTKEIVVLLLKSLNPYNGIKEILKKDFNK